MLNGGNVDLPYREIWDSNKIPSHTHDLYKGIEEQRYETPISLHILLLRNPCSLYSCVEPPNRRARPLTEVGCRSTWSAQKYAAQIIQFNRFPTERKMVVYYEDLVKDSKILLEVTDFAGIMSRQAGRRLDFDFIRQNAKRLYLEEGHVPSNKIVLKKEEKKKVLDAVRRRIGDDEIFDRYLKRYTIEGEMI